MKYFLATVGVIICMVLFEVATLPETTPEMFDEAAAYGAERGLPTPPNPFSYDGCTLFPDRLPGHSFAEACLLHDIAYWYGGPLEDRKASDELLRQGVADTGFVGVVLQYPVYLAVRMFGNTWLVKFFDANWGFGYN